MVLITAVEEASSISVPYEEDVPALLLIVDIGGTILDSCIGPVHSTDTHFQSASIHTFYSSFLTMQA